MGMSMPDMLERSMKLLKPEPKSERRSRCLIL
jgi:hypothetical protein